MYWLFWLGYLLLFIVINGKGIYMWKLVIVMVFVFIVIVGLVFVCDKVWYIGVEGGVLIVENIKFDIVGVSEVVIVK